jgi:D-beta-D-heptose 7-phosphate kinase/D-beta-D-heptose 1-phosphate adenosyltransferase
VTNLDARRLRTLLDGFPRAKVAILGDIMLDRYLWGDVNRISQEAPVPIVEVRRESARFGAAANVAENVASLGARAVLVGVVGDDDAGRELLSLLTGRGVDVDSVVMEPGRPTTTKLRVIAQSQQVVRADSEVTTDVAGDVEARVLDGLRRAMADSDVLIVSDYGKGVVTRTTIAVAISVAKDLGKMVCVDPKESHFGSYVGVTAITPNQKEAGAAVGATITDESTLLTVGWKLQKQLEAECVVVTRGEHGMSLFMSGGELVHLPTVARDVFDVTGAGDTVVSALAVALAAGASMEEAAIIANHAAGLVIREVGTASVGLDAIERSFKDSEEGERVG